MVSAGDNIGICAELWKKLREPWGETLFLVVCLSYPDPSDFLPIYQGPKLVVIFGLD